MSLNMCIFSGFVNKLEVTGSEQEKNLMAKFTLSVRKSYVKDENKKYNFVNAVAFGPVAKIVAERVKEGDMLEIASEFNTDSYTDQNGQNRYSQSFRVDRVSLCPSGNGNSNGQASAPAGNANNLSAPTPNYAAPSASAPSYTAPAAPAASAPQANRNASAPAGDGFVDGFDEGSLPWN